jgi:hypothetical protein
MPLTTKDYEFIEQAKKIQPHESELVNSYFEAIKIIRKPKDT